MWLTRDEDGWVEVWDKEPALREDGEWINDGAGWVGISKTEAAWVFGANVDLPAPGTCVEIEGLAIVPKKERIDNAPNT